MRKAVQINKWKNLRKRFLNTFVRCISSDKVAGNSTGTTLSSPATTAASGNVRVRFAPSPTGCLHVGGLRTALYNYLFAKAHKGSFILRIEDTDQARLVKGAVEKLEEDLHWVGLHPDEGPSRGGSCGPYIQSQRIDLYRTEVSHLLSKNRAYYCFCTDRRLDLLRKDALRRREVPKYDNHCRDLPKEQIEEKLELGISYCVRFKLTPFLRPFDDLVYGSVKHNVAQVEGDPVILKSDGFPTYHLANVVDDHYMNITHVLRGVEWLPSTVKHLLLYEAFNWQSPAYAHLPLLLNEDGTKLSKRHGDMTVENYRKNGIYPQALVNFLTICGGGFVKDGEVDTSQLKSMQELTERFSLHAMNVNNCPLPLERLKLLNRAEFKRLMSQENSSKELANHLRKLVANNFPEIQLRAVLSDVRLEQVLRWSADNNRISSLNDLVAPEFSFLWIQPPELPILKHSLKLFGALSALIMDVENFNSLDGKMLDSYFKHYAKEKQLKYSELMKFLRSCLSGLKAGPSVAEMFILLGKEEGLQRLRRAQKLQPLHSATDNT